MAADRREMPRPGTLRSEAARDQKAVMAVVMAHMTQDMITLVLRLTHATIAIEPARTVLASDIHLLSHPSLPSKQQSSSIPNVPLSLELTLTSLEIYLSKGKLKRELLAARDQAHRNPVKIAGILLVMIEQRSRDTIAGLILTTSR
jgi:hypothetical protein